MRISSETSATSVSDERQGVRRRARRATRRPPRHTARAPVQARALRLAHTILRPRRLREAHAAQRALGARMCGYSYTVRTARVLQRTHAVYFEKVRMALDAFDEGAEWVLWVDDDATINRADLSAASFIDLFPQADLIIAREV